MKYVLITQGGTPIYKYKILKHTEYHKDFAELGTNVSNAKLRSFLGECEDRGVIKLKSIDTLLIKFEDI